MFQFCKVCHLKKHAPKITLPSLELKLTGYNMPIYTTSNLSLHGLSNSSESTQHQVSLKLKECGGFYFCAKVQ